MSSFEVIERGLPVTGSKTKRPILNRVTLDPFPPWALGSNKYRVCGYTLITCNAQGENNLNTISRFNALFYRFFLFTLNKTSIPVTFSDSDSALNSETTTKTALSSFTRCPCHCSFSFLLFRTGTSDCRSPANVQVTKTGSNFFLRKEFSTIDATKASKCLEVILNDY